MKFVELKDGEVKQLLGTTKDGEQVVKSQNGEIQIVDESKIERTLTNIVEILKYLWLFLQFLKK